MYKTVIINDEILEMAIRQVDQLSIRENDANLRGVFDGAMLGKVESMWESFTIAIRETFIFGKEYSQQKINEVISSVETLIEQSKTKARDLHNYFKVRLQEFLKALINAAFQFIPQTIEIGTLSFPIRTISYAQKIGIGGSLKANFMEAVELTANGEIEIGVEYSNS